MSGGGDRLWLENGDECWMGGGLTKLSSTGGTPRGKKTCMSFQMCAIESSVFDRYLGRFPQDCLLVVPMIVTTGVRTCATVVTTQL